MINGSLDFGLKDKVAIVAGGGAIGQEIGNGRAASILLADAGVKVIVADKEEILAKNTVKMIQDRGGEVKLHKWWSNKIRTMQKSCWFCNKQLG